MIKYNPYVLMTDGSMVRRLSALNPEGQRQRFDSHYVETIFLKMRIYGASVVCMEVHTIFYLLDVSPS